MTTTDRGSNEVSARGITQSYISSRLGLAPVYYANSDCFEHLGHLITLGGMKLVDEELRAVRQWKYYSSLAVFSNTARGLGKKIYRQWCVEHSPSSAKERVFKLFPRCNSGRWNSTDETQKRIIACGQDMFQPVLKKVLSAAICDDKCGPASLTVWSDPSVPITDSAEQAEPPNKRARVSSESSVPQPKGKAKAKAQAKGTAKGSDSWQLVDGLAIQETQAYTEKIGKYRRSTLTCAEDKLWWLLIEIMNCCKQPTVHFSAFLKKRCATDFVAKHGNALTQLVHGRAQDFMCEFEQILDNPDLAKILDRAVRMLPAEESSFGFSLNRWAGFGLDNLLT